jgi:hypothetical protein
MLWQASRRSEKGIISLDSMPSFILRASTFTSLISLFASELVINIFLSFLLLLLLLEEGEEASASASIAEEKQMDLILQNGVEASAAAPPPLPE